MPDSTLHRSGAGDAAPASWRDAFAALPSETVPADGWDTLSRRLQSSRRRRWSRVLPLAAAAALLLALAPAWLQRPVAEQPSAVDARQAAAARPAGTPPTADAGGATLDGLHAESARLEALLQGARDGRVASGAAAALSAELDARLGAIDLALMQPGLDESRQLQLWDRRVQLLRAFAGFEGTRRWLAARGEHYDGALVRVD